MLVQLSSKYFFEAIRYFLFVVRISKEEGGKCCTCTSSDFQYVILSPSPPTLSTTSIFSHTHLELLERGGEGGKREGEAFFLPPKVAKRGERESIFSLPPSLLTRTGLVRSNFSSGEGERERQGENMAGRPQYSFRFAEPPQKSATAHVGQIRHSISNIFFHKFGIHFLCFSTCPLAKLARGHAATIFLFCYEWREKSSQASPAIVNQERRKRRRKAFRSLFLQIVTTDLFFLLPPSPLSTPSSSPAPPL